MKKNKPSRLPKGEPGPGSTQWLEFLNLGWIFAGTMTLTVGGGIWIDRRFGTTPAWLLIGTFLGFAGCGYSLYRVIQKLNPSDDGKPLK